MANPRVRDVIEKKLSSKGMSLAGESCASAGYYHRYHSFEKDVDGVQITAWENVPRTFQVTEEQLDWNQPTFLS